MFRGHLNTWLDEFTLDYGIEELRAPPHKVGEFFENEMRVEEILKTYERDLREFIKTTLKEKYGSNWWEDAVSDRIREKVAEEKEKKEKLSPSIVLKLPEDGIFYTSLNDLHEGIILAKKNWNEVYEYYFKDKNKTSAAFSEIRDVRNWMAHNYPDEFVSIELCLAQIKWIVRVFSKKIKCETKIHRGLPTSEEENKKSTNSKLIIT